MDSLNFNQPVVDFFRSTPSVRYQRQGVIVPAGSTSTDIFLVDEGFVKMTSASRQGRERIHFTFRAGEIFPLAQIFRAQPLPVSYVSINETRLHRQPIAAVREFFRTHPDYLNFVINELLEQREGIFTLSIDNAIERVVQHLIVMARRFGINSQDHVLIDLPITQQELAANVNLTRESAARILKQLEREKVLFLGRKRIIIYPEPLDHYIHSHRLIHIKTFAGGSSAAANLGFASA